MLLRFYQDVIALQPKAVVIFGGTNDIGSNIGPVPMETIENNLAAMADMAKGNGIKVIMASLTPVCDLPGKPPMTRGPPAREYPDAQPLDQGLFGQAQSGVSGLLLRHRGRQGIAARRTH